MGLAKARILLLDKVAKIPDGYIDVQFNPAEYSFSKSAQIAEINIPGIDSPILQFIRGQNEKLTLDLIFDAIVDDRGAAGDMTTEARSVTELTEPVYQLVKIQPELHAVPRVKFCWGTKVAFQAIVDSVQRKYTLFSPSGDPLRATLSVTFREYKTLEEQLKELKPQSTDHTQYVTARVGTPCSSIAAEVYDNPAEWREIALANGLVNPRRITPGTVLTVPPLRPFGIAVGARS